jgi:hypothetical protein
MADQPAKPFVAAVLPLGQLFDRVYLEAIVPCSTKLGQEAHRVPAVFSDRETLLKVQSELRDADWVIADLTARNPNVFYQVGYAHAAGKKVTLITQHGENMPLPESDHPVLIYAGNTAELLTLLRENLRQPQSSFASEDSSNPPVTLSEVARDKFFSIFGDLLAEDGGAQCGKIYMENDKTFILENQELDLALVQALARRARELGLRLKLL